MIREQFKTPPVKGVRVAPSGASAIQSTILTPDALEFLVTLHREFNPRRLELLHQRKARQQWIDRGDNPDFLPETKHIREGVWSVDPVPADLQDRRVEITGPADRKMVINALNSGASCYMADFEDSHAPTWDATLDAQANVRDAVRRQIQHTSSDGKKYRLSDSTATLLTRPRGWHLEEKHLLVDGEPISGSLFDFGLYFFHNAKERIEQGSAVYLYLPKLQHYVEARLWNDVFVRAQNLLGLPLGATKATVLIEHILAAFQMHEILYELRHHSAGLNCGRWDYIFSYIKTFASRPGFVLPDRSQVTMTTPMMRAYSLECIKTCHRRGTFAMGGMSAYIPIKSNPEANEKALAKVREDKRREAMDGHDGTWVAHPALVSVAREEFDAVLRSSANQIHRQREDVQTSAAELVQPPGGTITEEGLRLNIRVSVQYIEAWLGGLGCVPLYNLMEDAATAEISRAQIWQWIHQGAAMADGKSISLALFRRMLGEELDRVRAERGAARFANGRFAEAAQLLDDLVSASRMTEFLTLPAYEILEQRNTEACWMSPPAALNAATANAI